MSKLSNVKGLDFFQSSSVEKAETSSLILESVQNKQLHGSSQYLCEPIAESTIFADSKSL